MVLSVASGKGGTGKTTFAVNLAYALGRRGNSVRLLDCDVDEPNAHLFVQANLTEQKPVTVRKPVFDSSRCTACGKCADACNYNAIIVMKDRIMLFNELCNACGVCSYVCPEGALTERETVIGSVQTAPAHVPFFFVRGLLDIGETFAPKVVRGVKEYISPSAVNIIDASPGTGCAVVEAVESADAVLLVTEPTPFGLNDLKLAVQLTLKLKAPTGIIINRSDGEDRMIAEYASQTGIPVVGRIPFKREYAEAYSRGESLADRFPELRANLLNMYDHLRATLPPATSEDMLEEAQGNPAPFPVGTAAAHKEIAVVSGKGGTGKTTVVAAMAHLATNKVLADNDVDAADLHLLLQPTVREVHDFFGFAKAGIDASRCTGCGECADACHFNAIRHDSFVDPAAGKTYRIEPLACEGCGLCSLVCCEGAIQREEQMSGQWYVSSTDYGPMAHARLGIAEANSGHLVTQVRERSDRLASDQRRQLILGDGPLGTGCPVIASVSGTDLVVIITEPTVSGVHDMKRVMELTQHLSIPAVVVINKADLNAEQAHRIEQFVQAQGSRVIGRIPFDRAVNDALMEGKTVIEYGPGNAEEAIRTLWTRLQETLTALPFQVEANVRAEHT